MSAMSKCALWRAENVGVRVHWRELVLRGLKVTRKRWNRVTTTVRESRTGQTEGQIQGNWYIQQKCSCARNRAIDKMVDGRW